MNESRPEYAPGNFRVFSACDSKSAFGTEMAGARVYYLEETSSTQDVARQLAAENAPEGTIVIAGTQKKGRGRGDKSWHSPRGGLWFSIIFYPESELPARMLTLAGALAVAKSVRGLYGISAKIKWPNDCVINGRKVAGVLGETDGKAVVLGIGVNLNIETSELPEGLSGTATSIMAETGCAVQENVLLGALLRNVEDCYRALAAGGQERVLEELRLYSLIYGRQVSVACRGREYVGTAVDFDSVGALVLRLDSGVQKRIESGEIKCSLR